MRRETACGQPAAQSKWYPDSSRKENDKNVVNNANTQIPANGRVHIMVPEMIQASRTSFFLCSVLRRFPQGDATVLVAIVNQHHGILGFDSLGGRRSVTV